MISSPRIIIAGLGGDTGKTAISVGLCHYWQKKGIKVIPFKKGPDYIDMGWLERAARHPCYNLDLFMMNKEQVLTSFAIHSAEANGIAVIEGNRGLYDGMDIEGSVSTAEVAKLIKSPVILIVDCTKVTRTVSAIVFGCQMFDKDVSIKGVILNKLATSRHEDIIKKSIEYYCKIPVIGGIPKLKDVTFPGRHLGLVPPQEHPQAEEAIETSSDIVSKYLDIDLILDIAKDSPSIDFTPKEQIEPIKKKARIGIIKDSAFQFYYPENINSLRIEGAEIVEFSALRDRLPSELDALYIGGGFPETHAEQLAENKELRRSIREAAFQGLPIYAECGGLMYLCEELIWNEKHYPMAGVFPITIGVSKKPQGHGYAEVLVTGRNPFFRTGSILRGHEFHYSYVLEIKDEKVFSFVFKLNKGNGVVKGFDGLYREKTLATYVHLHSYGTSEWAKGLVTAGENNRKKNIISK